MKKNDLLHFYRNFQIIDVTEQCTFEWIQEPSPCKAYLEVSDASGDFTEGEIIENLTNGTSTAKVFSSYVDGNRVYIEDISGSFNHGDQIKGNTSGQTATVDSFVEERSYPDNIIKGTFPNSIISKDIDDYLEWESTRIGSGNIGSLRIIVSKNGIYGAIIIGGVGNRVDSKIFSRMFQWRVIPTYATPVSIGMGYASSSEFNRFLGISQTLTFFPVMKYGNEGQEMQTLFLYFYQNNKGTARWRIHNIRVLKLII